MKIPQSVRELIEKGPLAHLTTLSSSGAPQVTVVWVGIQGEEFVMGHLATHQKVKNIRRDPRVALSMLGDKTNAQGLREYLVIHGNARVTEGGAVELLQRLGPIYLGPQVDFSTGPHAEHSRLRHQNYAGTFLWDRTLGSTGH
jgi:PPOX class probable F420-dependent enzyme